MRRILNSKKKSYSGYSLVEVIVSLGLVFIISSGGYVISKSFIASSSQLTLVQGVMQYRRTIIDMLRSSDALARISGLAANSTVPGINCLATLQSCGAASTAYVPFSIADVNGNYLTRHDQANFGFDLHQTTCTTYPSPECPYRILLEWAALCNSVRPGSCATPQLVVRGTFQLASSARIQIPTESFSFSQTLSKYIGSYEQSCSSLGGTYVASDPPRCTLPAEGDCGLDAAGNPQVVAGYNRLTNMMDCRPYFGNALNDVVCPDGTVIVATNSTDGAPTACVPIIAAPPPGLTPVPWCDVNPTHPSCINVIPAMPGDGGADGGCGGGGGC